ncbi:MAG: glycosyltransferase family 2 protein [Elusimicrobia bacterium]|nr:glycosyltransferase family 2 protein [Candidatus Obscuribacterium magneticum]
MHKKNPPKVAIVMPAYYAAKTLERTLRDIPPGSYADLILVDDASKDGTFELAKKLGIYSVRHEKNTGYGGNQKNCYRLALDRGADIVVMLHPDYQYDAKLIPYMTGLIQEGICDMILGSRIRTRHEALKGGMPLYKYLMNRLLTLTENMILGIAVSETHTGFRAYHRSVLEMVTFERNSDDFLFDQQFIIQAVHHKFRIGEIPVPTRYFSEASSISFKRSVVYGLGTLWALVRFILHQLRLVKYSLLEPKAFPQGSA